MFVVQSGYEAAKSMPPGKAALALLIGVAIAAALFTVIFIVAKKNRNRKK